MNTEDLFKQMKKAHRAKIIERVLKYGIALGWMASMLYLMLILTAYVTA